MTKVDVVELASEARLIHTPCIEKFAQLLLQAERERIANQIDRMPFGDTAASFAVWIRAGAP